MLRDLDAGKLTAADEAVVREASAKDPGLAKFNQFVQWLTPRLQALDENFPGLHANGEELVLAALGPLGELPEKENSERREWVEAHLDSCAECRKLVATIKQIDSTATESPSVTRRAWSRPGKTWPTFAVAATLVVAVFGAGLFLGQRESAPVVAPFRLAAVSRAVAELPVVTLTGQGNLPPFILAFDPWVGRLSADDYFLQLALVFKGDPAQQWQFERGTGDSWRSELNGVQVELDIPGQEHEEWVPGHYSLEVTDELGLMIYQGEFRLVLPGD